MILVIYKATLCTSIALKMLSKYSINHTLDFAIIHCRILKPLTVFVILYISCSYSKNKEIEYIQVQWLKLFLFLFLELVICPNEIEELCEENIEMLASSVKGKLGLLMDRHLNERIKLSKLRKVNPNTWRVNNSRNNSDCLPNKALLNLAAVERPDGRLESVTSF